MQILLKEYPIYNIEDDCDINGYPIYKIEVNIVTVTLKKMPNKVKLFQKKCISKHF